MLSEREATPEYLTIKEVADRLRVSVSTVRKWIKQQGLPAVKPGGDWRIRSRDLDHWLASRRENA